MDFKSALQQVANQFGKEIHLQNKVVSILSDFQAFSDAPSYRVVLRNLIRDGVVFKYVKTNNINERDRLISTFVSQTGFEKQICTTLLNHIYSIFTGRSAIENNNHTSVNNQSSKENLVSAENESEKELKIQKSSKLSVLGVELGSPYSDFHHKLNHKGFERPSGSGLYWLNDFAGLKDVEIKLLKYEYSKLVYNICVSKIYTHNLDCEYELNRLIRLYTMKYGKGMKGIKGWRWSDNNKNSIYIHYTLSDFIIEYSYSIPNIGAIESAKKKEAEDLRRAELEKRRQEELKRKQREDALRKQEETKNLRKNLMDI